MADRLGRRLSLAVANLLFLLGSAALAACQVRTAVHGTAGGLPGSYRSTRHCWWLARFVPQYKALLAAARFVPQYTALLAACQFRTAVHGTAGSLPRSVPFDIGNVKVTMKIW